MTASSAPPMPDQAGAPSGAPEVLYRSEDAITPAAAGDTFLATIAMEDPSGLARDRRIITSHWQALTGTPTPQDLATTLANGMTLWFTQAYYGHVTVYKSDFAPPGTHHEPLAQVTMGTSASPVGSNVPGELALCLSYFCTFNIKRQRGRNYIPHEWIYAAMAGVNANPGTRPTAAIMNKALGIWDIVYKPVSQTANWQWVLKSPTDKAHKIITDVWVDDEWDNMSSRGLRSTSRVTAKT
jgi:hypothetical protein